MEPAACALGLAPEARARPQDVTKPCGHFRTDMDAIVSEGSQLEGHLMTHRRKTVDLMPSRRRGDTPGAALMSLLAVVALSLAAYLMCSCLVVGLTSLHIPGAPRCSGCVQRQDSRRTSPVTAPLGCRHDGPTCHLFGCPAAAMPSHLCARALRTLLTSDMLAIKCCGSHLECQSSAHLSSASHEGRRRQRSVGSILVALLLH